ncbi:hypothetical protein DFP73DRAFT_599376 [Morchella snyderi]|nr:hypothetical protein DFP73DRAFT_599376 [Morchella snyderi]
MASAPHDSTGTSTPSVGDPTSDTFSVCVFCGANAGTSPSYTTAATALATTMHANNWSLVYGGGTVGLMGTVSRTLRSLGGNVHGIVPQALVAFEQGGVTPDETEYGKTTVVNDMHTRKSMMGKLSNAFVALPGGFGTMEELFEVVTWNQLGIHACPIVLFNVDGFYDGLLAWVRSAVEAGFIKPGAQGIIVEAKTAEEVADRIRDYAPASGRMNLNWGLE